MRIFLSAVIVALIACSSFLLHGFVSGSQLPVIPSFNTTQFLGRWFQAYSDFTVMNTFERNGVCIFADYGLFANGTVSVHNQMRLYTADGNETSIQGFAQPDGSGLPGRLTVQLGGTPFPAPYWIVDIGPVINDKYEWMIVTDNLQLTMWVLVRDVEEYMKRSDNSRHAVADAPVPAYPPLYRRYNADVQVRLEELGFTQFWNKPLLTNQTGCTYPPPAKIEDDEAEQKSPRIRLSEI